MFYNKLQNYTKTSHRLILELFILNDLKVIIRKNIFKKKDTVVLFKLCRTNGNKFYFSEIRKSNDKSDYK